MKKVLAILTALFLAVGCTAALAEEDDFSVPPSTPEMKAYESNWISEDGKTLVWIGRQDDGFQVQAVRRTGEDTFTSWEYLSLFDTETRSLKNAEGNKCDCRYTDGRDEMIDGTSVDGIKASFTLDETGMLIWKDEQAGTETKLQKIGNFTGRYIYDRAIIDFVWDVHDNHYDILVTWGQSGNQVWDYQLVGVYDPKTETVKFQGLKQLLTYTENGEIDSTAEIQQGELEGTFTLNESGGLVWQSTDGSGDGIVFEPEWLPLWASELAF